MFSQKKHEGRICIQVVYLVGKPERPQGKGKLIKGSLTGKSSLRITGVQSHWDQSGYKAQDSELFQSRGRITGVFIQ